QVWDALAAPPLPNSHFLSHHARLLKCLLQLAHKRSLTFLQAVASHGAPEIILLWPQVPVVKRQHILRWARLDHKNNVRLLRAIDQDIVAPFLDRVWHRRDGLAIFRPPFGIEGVAWLGSHH